MRVGKERRMEVMGRNEGSGFGLRGLIGTVIRNWGFGRVSES